MSQHSKYKVKLVILYFFIVSTYLNAANYTLVIEPTYPIDQGKQVYEPLRKWLSKQIGHELEVIIDNNYYLYWTNANKDRNPDFTYDAPHIAAFRMQKKGYHAIATTIEPLSFHLISLDEPEKDETFKDYLISKRIVMLPSPSLASIYFKQWFTELFSAPIKDVTALSWQEAVEIIFDGGAQAAIVPNWIYNIYPNFASLAESQKTPGTTFMASTNVPAEVVEKFQSALLSLKDDKAAYDVLVELNTEGFKKPILADYTELTQLLPKN